MPSLIPLPFLGHAFSLLQDFVSSSAIFQREFGNHFEDVIRVLVRDFLDRVAKEKEEGVPSKIA